MCVHACVPTYTRTSGCASVYARVRVFAGAGVRACASWLACAYGRACDCRCALCAGGVCVFVRERISFCHIGHWSYKQRRRVRAGEVYYIRESAWEMTSWKTKFRLMWRHRQVDDRKHGNIQAGRVGSPR